MLTDAQLIAAGKVYLDVVCAGGRLSEGLAETRAALAARPAPVATQMQMLDHLESLKTDPVVLAQLRDAPLVEPFYACVAHEFNVR